MSTDPLGDNLKEAVNSFDRLIQRIRDLRAVGQAHLAYFGPAVKWNHLKSTEASQTYLCGEPAERLTPFYPESQQGRWCEDCKRILKANPDMKPTL